MAGRPPQAETTRKRNQIAFRVSDEIRDKLQSDADAAQRSLSEEIEFRLQRDADMQTMLVQLAMPTIVESLLRSIAGSVRATIAMTADHGPDELDVRKAVAAAIDHVKDIYCWTGTTPPPPPDGAISDHGRPPVKARDRPAAARGYLGATYNFESPLVANRNPDPLFEDWCEERVLNRWTGNGDEVVVRRSLESIMSNSPGDRADRLAKKKKRRLLL